MAKAKTKTRQRADARRGAVRTAWAFGAVALLVYLVSILLH